MKRNCEDEPLGLIELFEYAFEAYEILQTHYGNRMVSDVGVIISGVTKGSYFENITIEAHIPTTTTARNVIFARFKCLHLCFYGFAFVESVHR